MLTELSSSGVVWVGGRSPRVRGAEASGGPVPSVPPGTVRKRIRGREVAVEVVLDDELGDAVATRTVNGSLGSRLTRLTSTSPR